MRSLIKTGDLFGAEMLYDIIPNQLDLFDYDTFNKNEANFYSVVTNINTGKPEYIKINDLKKVKHDYGSQISYLYGLCLMGKYEKLTDSLKSIINGHDNIISEVEIYNNDSIISMIVNGIKHKGISVV